MDFNTYAMHEGAHCTGEYHQCIRGIMICVEDIISALGMLHNNTDISPMHCDILQCTEHLQCTQDILQCSEHPLCIDENLPNAMYNPLCTDDIHQCTEH